MNFLFDVKRKRDLEEDYFVKNFIKIRTIKNHPRIIRKVSKLEHSIEKLNEEGWFLLGKFIYVEV